jgi:DnaJ family protein C protein 11
MDKQLESDKEYMSQTEMEAMMENLDDLKEIPSQDYYGILNCHKTASEDDIKNAYRKRSLLFHPDRFQSEQDRVNAQEMFQIVHKAYEVLSNPTRRYMYDKYGAEAADTPWEVGNVLKTPQEMAEEYERNAKIQALDDEFTSSLQAVVHVDASRIFHRYSNFKVDSFLNIPGSSSSGYKRGFGDLVKITGASISQTWETWVNQSTSVSLGGSILVRNSIGLTNFTSSIKTILSPIWSVNVSAAVGPNPSASIRFDRPVGNLFIFF